jgi:antirestriction protein ArdC
MQKIYEEVTKNIIINMEKGVLPWQRPWSINSGMPMNLHSGRHYRSANILSLWNAANTHGFESDLWLTQHQAEAKLGGSILKNEKGTIIFCWRPVPIKGSTKKSSRVITKFFTVFNVSQVSGIDIGIEDRPKTDWQSEEKADELLKLATIEYGGNHAFYVQEKDMIRLPDRKSFDDAAGFYATALHELSHWTGADHRLGRLKKNPFGSPAYCKEELVAEMGSAFLCSMLGIKGHLQHPEYLKHWMDALRSDGRTIFTAASRAQKAVDFAICSAKLNKPSNHVV